MTLGNVASSFLSSWGKSKTKQKNPTKILTAFCFNHTYHTEFQKQPLQWLCYWNGFQGKTRRIEAWFLQIVLLYANVQTVAALAHALVCISCWADFAGAKRLALTLLTPGNYSACSIALLLAMQYDAFLMSISTFFLFRNLHKKPNIFYTFIFLASFFRKL